VIDNFIAETALDGLAGKDFSMVATVGSIAVAFSADLRRYEAELRRGEKVTDRFERNATKATTGVGAAFVRMGGLAKAAIGGLVAGVAAAGVTGIVRGFGDIARSIAEVGDQAKLAGLSVRTFQEWKYVARQTRIPVDAMADAFKELSLRADEFATTGKGSAAEAFGRIGLSQQEVKERLSDPAALMLLIIERTRQLGDTAAGIRIFDEILGGQGGEQFVRLIDQGADAIRGTIDEAHRLNAVMSDDMVESAAELDRKFNALATAVGSNLKRAIVEAAGALTNFIDRFRAFESQQTANLDAELAVIGKQRLDLENRILKLRGEQGDAIAGNPFGRDYASDIQYLEEERAALGETETQILRVIEARRKAAEVPPPAPTTTAEWTPIDTGSGGGGRDKAAAAADRKAEAVRNLISELEHELSIIGATALQQDIANTLRQAGAAATADQQARITSLISALHAEAEAQRQAADAAALYRDIAGGVLNDLRSALSDGKLEWQELADVAVRALDRIVDKILNDLLDALFQVGSAGRGGGNFHGTLGTLNLTKGF
jgi:uncharacterized surface protein with fasciclin (FAS1) repeats